MDRLFIAIILALLPVASFFLQKKLCVSAFDKKSFSNFFPVIVSDWFFVPFNFILAYVVNFNYWIFGIFVVTIVVSFILSSYWEKAHKEEKNPIYLWDNKKRKMTSAGWVHTIYAWIQAVLVLMFIFFSTNMFLDYFAIFWFLVYILFIPLGSKRLHGKFIGADRVYFYGAFLVFLAKFIFLVY